MELLPLNAEQHVVTFVPKLTAELPFFNLTSYQKNLPSVIKFRGVDQAGHPINWEVYQNTNKEIGSPRADAHRVWYQLVKPAADRSRKHDGTMPEIIPLGKIRQCLRSVGWTAGGHQERKLIRSLNQIGSAWCVADLWVPTNSVDEMGRPKYVQVKGRFSRLSVYAIGEHHLTEEELKTVNFEFDLEDILYIKLDPLEVRMQAASDQRLYDNLYWFSVDPAARRWYELLAPKVFGAVKNNAPFFEVNYSWYVQHHHTLKRFYERRRVVEQMNRLVKDHLTSRYIRDVEYRVVKYPDQEIDYIIRYYPGPAAGESIERIQDYIRKKRTRQATSHSWLKRHDSKSRHETPNLTGTVNALSVITAEHLQIIGQLMMHFGVSIHKAHDLAVRKKESAMTQLSAWPFREGKPRSRAGWIIQAIENNYEVPVSYIAQIATEAQAEDRAARQSAIDACGFCNQSGFRYIKNAQYPNGAMRQCTHDSAVENKTSLDALNDPESDGNPQDEKTAAAP